MPKIDGRNSLINEDIDMDNSKDDGEEINIRK